MDQQKVDYYFYYILLLKLTRQCEYNMDNLEAIDIYNNIGEDIFNKETKKYIIIEKLFVIFNDSLIDIRNKLNI